MVELTANRKALDLPYTVRIHGVSATLFDELVDEDTRAELIDGVMVVHSPASVEHDQLGGFVRGLMDFYVDARGLGTVLGPDSMMHLATCRRFAANGYFVRKGRKLRRKQKEFHGTPDLVLEVLSPSNRDLDLESKRPAYQAAGVGEIWIIDPENQIVLVDRRRGKRHVEQEAASGRLSSSVIDGFWLDVGWLWQEPLPGKLVCLKEILGESKKG
jgi:Uma2 family endonuclease